MGENYHQVMAPVHEEHAEEKGKNDENFSFGTSFVTLFVLPLHAYVDQKNCRSQTVSDELPKFLNSPEN